MILTGGSLVLPLMLGRHWGESHLPQDFLSPPRSYEGTSICRAGLAMSPARTILWSSRSSPHPSCCSARMAGCGLLVAAACWLLATGWLIHLLLSPPSSRRFFLQCLPRASDWRRHTPPQTGGGALAEGNELLSAQQ